MSDGARELENAILRNLLARTTRAYEEQVVALSREKELAQVTLASIGDGVISTDEEGRVRYLNPVAEELTGWSAAEAEGEPLSRVFRLLDESSGEDRPVEAGSGGAGVGEEDERRVLARPDGQRFAVEHTAAPIRSPDGRAIGQVIVFQDVTDQRLMALQLAHQASHDPLTGLLNRQAFDDHLERLLRTGGAGGAGRSHCLLYMDLDQFKVVNDTCGHMAGDELLRRIATLVAEQVREEDVVARLGGDELGVLLPDCPQEAGLRIAERIHAVLNRFRFGWQDKSFAVGVSIGLVPISGGVESIAQVLSAADHACYVAKERGRNRVQVYQRDDAEVVRRTDEMNWVVRIHKTLEEGRFRLYAQRIARLAGAGPEDEAPLFLEVLLRMLDEDGSMLAPTPFVRAAERYGLMRDIDRWVVTRVLEHLESLPEDVLARVGTCAINLSAVSLSDESFLELARVALHRHAVPPEKICFEITETAAVANLEQAQRLIRELSALGCRFALDDFGSGMASYSKLKALRVSYLKIDGTFVRDLGNNPLDRAMVRSINQLAHVLGIETIAEGVSTPALLDRLRFLGIDYAQGYGIDRPGPLEEALGKPASWREASGDSAAVSSGDR